MPTYSQAELQRHVEIFLHNGPKPQAQAVLAGIGYSPEKLDQGAALLGQWRQHKMQAKTLLAAQKKATRTERTARKQARLEATRLSQTVRVLFGDNEEVLTSLGLYPSLWRSNGHSQENGTAPVDGNGQETNEADQSETGNGNGSSHNRRSYSTAALIARWRILFGNAQTLPAEYQAQLAETGWSAERLVAGADLVERYATADSDQQEAIQDYRSETALAREIERELRQWYRSARRLVQIAVKADTPDGQTQLKDLLGV